MYKCQKCGKVTNPGEKLNKIVTATREKIYTNPILGKDGKLVKDRFGNILEKITHGTEICGELCVCDKCFGVKKEYNNTLTRVKSNNKNYEKPSFNKTISDNKNNTTERKYPNSNYQGKNFDPDFYKKKYANQNNKAGK